MNKIVPKSILLFFICFIGCTKIFSATIEGFEPSYAGRILNFYTYSDPVLKTETELFRLTIDKNGHFKEEVKVVEPVFCLSNFDVFKGILILEPESALKIKLPQLREKTTMEAKNPYFKPIVFWIHVDSEKNDEINSLVSNLEQQYIKLTNQYFNQLYYRNSMIYFDSVKITLNKAFLKYKLPLLNNQVELKLKLLEADINPASHHTIFKEISLTKTLLSNPTFINLFDLLFTNKLSFEVNSIKGGELKKAVGSGDILFIKKYFQEKYNLNSGLADFVTLKELHDAYYSNQFSQKAIIAMLDNQLFANNSDKQIRQVALDLKQKLQFLNNGTAAPVICLNNLAGQQKCSNKLTGCRYIIFADTEMLVCREHLKYLATIASKFKGQLEIFIILKHSGSTEIQKFFDENEVPGIIVIEENDNRFAGEYKVRSYPSAFLLNEKHEVVLAPAKNPLDGFEQEFAALLRNEQMQKFRNQK